MFINTLLANRAREQFAPGGASFDQNHRDECARCGGAAAPCEPHPRPRLSPALTATQLAQGLSGLVNRFVGGLEPPVPSCLRAGAALDPRGGTGP